MEYICLQPCTIGGKKYFIDDIIPSEVVIEEKAQALVEMGLITSLSRDAVATGTLEVSTEDAEDTMFVTLLGKRGEENVAVGVTIGDVQLIMIALQMNAESAAEFVRENITDSSALEVLERLDARKTVKNVIKEITAQTAGEQ